jgi:hypothetical protein
MEYLYEARDQISDFCHQWLQRKMCIYVYKKQLSQQTGSRNTTGPKTLPTIWHTYMKLVTKYQIPVINSCLEKFNKISKEEVGIRWVQKCFPRYGVPIWRLLTKYQISAINSCLEIRAYMLNVHKNQVGKQEVRIRQVQNLPTIWYTYTTLVTKYQISAINRYWEKYLGRTEVKQYTPSPFRERV